MPFKSEKQRRYLHINKPSVAKAWERKYAHGGYVKKFKGGGMDATKPSFKVPAKRYEPPPGEKGGAGYVKKTSAKKVVNLNTKAQNFTDNLKANFSSVPIIGPVTFGINLLKNIIKPKSSIKKNGHPFSTNTKKQLIPKPIFGVGGAGKGRSPQLCPDGTMPPCKTTPIVKPNQANKSNFLEGFKAYNKGGGVPYGPPPSRGPNPQVPPVKFSRGGGSAIRGTKFKGVF
jgi:hypothetical protein